MNKEKVPNNNIPKTIILGEPVEIKGGPHAGNYRVYIFDPDGSYPYLGKTASLLYLSFQELTDLRNTTNPQLPTTSNTKLI